VVRFVDPSRGDATVRRLMGGALSVVLATAAMLATAGVPAAAAQPAPPTAPPEPPAPPTPPEPATTPPDTPAAIVGDPVDPPALPPGFELGAINVHGFVSQGAFVSTANDYIGTSSRGSLELFEASINFSSELSDRLRAGLQLFARDYGNTEDTSARVDWAFLDYRWRQWLGFRAGIIKMPYGLYNEYTDVDAARLPILMPQSVYPYRNRDVLLSHRGLTLYGSHALGSAGELEYSAWFGTLSIPRNALTLIGAELESVDTKYILGGRVFWSPPVDGLRIGVTAIQASIDFHLKLADASTAQLIMLGLVPPDYDGAVVISQRPAQFAIASLEYAKADWLVAAEYGWAPKRQRSSLPALIPTFEKTSEQFYVMAAKRLSPRFEIGGYYSVRHVDIDHRLGRDKMQFAERHHAFQRDASATVRIDINPYWLWKLEAHFIDGTADLIEAGRSGTERYWGMFLAKTTVTF
jgi:hypothetical protein